MSCDIYKSRGQKESQTSKELNNTQAIWSKEVQKKGEKQTIYDYTMIYKMKVYKALLIIHHLLCSQCTLIQCNLKELYDLKVHLDNTFISFLCAHSSLSFCVAQESLSLDSLTGQPPLSVKSLLNAYHHVDVSSLHDSQPAGVFWDTVTGPSFSPMLLHRGEGEKTTPVDRQTSSTVCIPAQDKNTVHLKQNPIFKNTVLLVLMMYD